MDVLDDVDEKTRAEAFAFMRKDELRIAKLSKSELQEELLAARRILIAIAHIRKAAHLVYDWVWRTDLAMHLLVNSDYAETVPDLIDYYYEDVWD